MMTKDDYQHFVCIVAGENPDELMERYDKGKKVDPYVVYRYKDAGKLKQSYLSYYESLLETPMPGLNVEELRETIKEFKEMDADDFYEELTADYEKDDETGDAMSDANKEGHWSYCSIGKSLSIPFLTKDGKELFQARKGDIDWEKIHLAGQDIYNRTWEMCMEGSKPQNDYERTIYQNMGDKTTYFKKFETKENYVTSNTAFWGYAFVSEKTGWQEADEIANQFAWMKNYYDLFIKNLDDGTLLTIYECKK